MAPIADGCPDPAHRPALSKQEALDLLLSQVRPITDTAVVATDAGLGRVLAEPVVSAIAVPGWDNSAMDGYAVRCADLTGGPARLRVAQRIPAGAVGLPLAPGTAARIFTGAPVPPGADAVEIQERCERDWGLGPGPCRGRPRGEHPPRRGGHRRRCRGDRRRDPPAAPTPGAGRRRRHGAVAGLPSTAGGDVRQRR